MSKEPTLEIDYVLASALLKEIIRMAEQETLTKADEELLAQAAISLVDFKENMDYDPSRFPEKERATLESLHAEDLELDPFFNNPTPNLH